MPGDVASPSIQDLRKSLPIYELRERLLQEIRDVYPDILLFGGNSTDCFIEPNPHRCRRHGNRQDNSADPISSRSWIRRPRQNRLHTTPSRRRHVRRKTRCRGGRLSSRSGGRLRNSLRGLHKPRDADQVPDGRHAPTRMPRRPRFRGILRDHGG